LCLVDFLIGEQDDGEQHVGEGGVMVLVAVLVAELSVGAEELFEYGEVDSFPHDAFVVHAQFEDLGVDVLMFAQQLDRFFGLAGVAREVLQVRLQVVEFVRS
jgi:hypothetical protein